MAIVSVVVGYDEKRLGVWRFFFFTGVENARG
jgi:hypothetical protein